MITQNGNASLESAFLPTSPTAGGKNSGASSNGNDIESATLRQVLAAAGAFSMGGGDLAAAGVSAEQLLIVITAYYAALLQEWDASHETQEAQIQFNKKLRALRSLTTAALALRRAEFQAARLQLARERLEFLQEKQRNKAASSTASRATRASSSIESASAPQSPASPIPSPTNSPSRASVFATPQRSEPRNPATPGVLQSVQRSLSMPQLTIDHLFPELTKLPFAPLSGPIQTVLADLR